MHLPNHIFGTLLLCAIPYLGVLVYVLTSHTDAHALNTPGPLTLTLLVLAGALTPLGRLMVVLRWLMAETQRFRLDLLMQSYASLLLIFASLYALLNIGSAGEAFVGMTEFWGPEGMQTVEHHVWRLHHVFSDALYFSVMTMTTVGYGDIAPSSGLARALTMVQAVVGIGFWGVSVGQYFAYQTRQTDAFLREGGPRPPHE